MKSVEMLFFSSPLVMMPFATEGMAAASQVCFHHTPAPEHFAILMADLAGTPFLGAQALAEARARFGQRRASRPGRNLDSVVERNQRLSKCGPSA